MTKYQYNVNKNTIECDGYFVAYVNCVDGFRIANKLTVLAEENEQLLKEKIDAETKLYKANEQLLMQMDYDNLCKENQDMEFELIKIKKENEQLKQQLLYDGDDVCSICKHEYLTPSGDYFIGKCKKGYEECSKEDINYCEDFEKELEERLFVNVERDGKQEIQLMKNLIMVCVKIVLKKHEREGKFLLKKIH